MSLKSNSGTSTSEDSTTRYGKPRFSQIENDIFRDDELLVKKKKYKVLDRLPHKHLDKSFSAATLEATKILFFLSIIGLLQVKKPQQIVVRPVLSAPGGDNKEIVNGRSDSKMHLALERVQFQIRFTQGRSRIDEDHSKSPKC